ncbi:MAG: hypothetical protein WC069_03700 [Candidatus Shapirobacteria bacterium]
MKWVNYPFKMEKQYRRTGWDYSKNGYYFITICTKDRTNYFGEIINHEMYLSDIGILVHKLWVEILNHNKGIELDKYIVMPNHFHGILIINRVGGNRSISNSIGRNMTMADSIGRNMTMADSIGRNMTMADSIGRNMTMADSIGRNMPRHVPTIKNNIQTNEFSKPISNSVSMIINRFKGSVKRECNNNDIKFDWQSRFHDRIIRSEKEYWVKRIYVDNNPVNWEKDINNKIYIP